MGLQIAIVIAIDILLNEKKYNLKVLEFTLALGFFLFLVFCIINFFFYYLVLLIFADVIVFDSIALILTTQFQ